MSIKSGDRWGNESSRSNNKGFMDLSNATNTTEATLPCHNRRRRNSIDEKTSTDENKGNTVAPRLPRRILSSGSDSDGASVLQGPTTATAFPEQSKEDSRGALRRMSLPSFASSNTYEDEDSILDQATPDKPKTTTSRPVRRGSLGMKKEKVGPKYGMKMGYGFEEASIGSDSDTRGKRKEKKPAKKEEDDPALVAPTLGTFLEKKVESPTRVLGGRSVGSGTISNEDIMGIGPSKVCTSWKTRPKTSNQALGVVIEQDVDATPPKSTSSPRQREDRPECRGSLADHLNACNSSQSLQLPAVDYKSLGGASSGRSTYSGYSFGSTSTSSDDEWAKLSGLPRATVASVRRTMMGGSDESSLAAFSRSSHASSISSDDELRQAFTLAMLKSSNQRASNLAV